MLIEAAEQRVQRPKGLKHHPNEHLQEFQALPFTFATTPGNYAGLRQTTPSNYATNYAADLGAHRLSSRGGKAVKNRIWICCLFQTHYMFDTVDCAPYVLTAALQNSHGSRSHLHSYTVANLCARVVNCVTGYTMYTMYV